LFLSSLSKIKKLTANRIYYKKLLNLRIFYDKNLKALRKNPVNNLIIYKIRCVVTAFHPIGTSRINVKPILIETIRNNDKGVIKWI